MNNIQEPRDLTFEERATWGTCPICQAEPGTYCFADAGIQLGMKINGSRMKDGDGAHLGRLNLSPKRVQYVAVD